MKRTGSSQPGAVRRWPKLLCLCIVALSLVAALVSWTSGLSLPMERMLASQRDALRTRPASTDYVFIELDGQSLAAIESWPWPRRNYAQAIAILNRAGVGTIGFDIDFSAESNPVDDALFAQAISQSHAPVILPTFRQAASRVSSREIENLPIAPLREKAQVAAVNIFTEGDGLVRSYPYAVVTDGVPRPSMASMLANGAGRADETFPIDYAIDPATIPHISFIDLLRGRFDPAILRGKSVLIGASAIELGDRYLVPIHGVLPGPVIQLLAAQTLAAGSSPVDRGPFIPLLLAGGALAVAMRMRRRLALLTLGGAILAIAALPLALEATFLGTLSVVPALAGLSTAMAIIGVVAGYGSIRQLRLYDQETGLPNRRALLTLEKPDRLRELLALRIANYGNVVGAAGQGAADEMVLKIADRLRLLGLARIYRTQTDLLVFPVDRNDPDELDARVESMVAVLRPRVEIGGRQLDLQTSVGVALAGEGSLETLLDHATLAAEHAASTGCRWEVYGEALEDAENWRLALAEELDAGLAAGDLHLVYQPKFNLAEGRVTAVEALVRWDHPVRGPVSPESFIPALEENGRIGVLSLFVARRAIEACAEWRAAGHEINVAINISAALLTDKAFTGEILAMVEASGLPPAMITLEITETATMADTAAAHAAMERLAAFGVRLSIDDYGTGQSTLSYLKQLPATELKIDKSFILGLESSSADQAMVRSTIALAHELGYSVVAEGVETEAILARLREFGCHYAQGWHISRPLPADRLLAFVGTQRKAA